MVMRRILVLVCMLSMVVACKQNKKESQVVEKSTPETIENEWISLMGADQWRGYNQDSLPGNWVIKDDIIECFGTAGDVGGDIISTEQYDNFEFSLEWKISKGGNSGIFYHVVEDTIYHSPYQTGPEYQILDDEGFPDPLEDWQTAGSNYAMHPTNSNKVLKPVGEWNSTRVIFNKGKVEHWLNGEKVVEFDKFSDDWKAKRNSGKWNDYPDYGNVENGYLGLQDHGAGVWFRNVKVRRL